MGNRKLSDSAAALVVALLLLVTAWGNAWVMLAAAGLVLLGMLLLFRDNLLHDGALPATAAALVGVAIALMMILPLGR
jgi:hypothetical protein